MKFPLSIMLILAKGAYAQFGMSYFKCNWKDGYVKRYVMPIFSLNDDIHGWPDVYHQDPVEVPPYGSFTIPLNNEGTGSGAFSFIFMGVNSDGTIDTAETTRDSYFDDGLWCEDDLVACWQRDSSTGHLGNPSRAGNCPGL